MKRSVKTLGITAALAVMIPFSAYAATTGTSSGETTEKPAWSVKGGSFEGRGGIVSQEVLDLLKLDQAALKEKTGTGKTLAQIAEEQGVSRESLKNVMTEAYNKKLEERKQNFANNLDKAIDSELKPDKHGRMGGGFRGEQDLTAVAKLLGLSADELKEQLKAGKSLAELATEKGVEAQKLIDAQAASMTTTINEALKAGKLTQEQADKQLANAADLAEKIVNGKGFGEGRHHGGGKGRGFEGGEKRPAAAGTSAEQSAEPSAAS